MATFKKWGKGHEVKESPEAIWKREREHDRCCIGVSSCVAGIIWTMPSEPMCLCGLYLRPLRVPVFTSLLEYYRYVFGFICLSLSISFFLFISLGVFLFLQIPLPSKPYWYLVFGATKEDIKEICISTMKLYSREKVEFVYLLGTLLWLSLFLLIVVTTVAVVNTPSISQPNREQLEKQVDKRKVALEEARLKAKGQNPNGTPALSAIGGFSPASKPCKFLFLFAFY